MQISGYLLDWEKALKLKAEGKLREVDIEDYTESLGDDGDFDDEEDDDDEVEEDEEDEDDEEIEDDEEGDGGVWASDSLYQYQLVSGAYTLLRKGLSPSTQSASDVVMDFFGWNGEASRNRLQDLGEGACPNNHYFSLSPENVRRILREAEKMDFAEFKRAYEKHVPAEDQEELGPYALNVESYIRDQWIGALRMAAERGLGFGVHVG